MHTASYITKSAWFDEFTEKKMNFLLKAVTILSLILVSGCSVKNKKITLDTPKRSVEHQMCIDTCEIMGMCAKLSGASSNKKQVQLCTNDCLGTPKKLRDVVSSCAQTVLIKECNPVAMSACVQRSMNK